VTGIYRRISQFSAVSAAVFTAEIVQNDQIRAAAFTATLVLFRPFLRRYLPPQ